MTPVRVDQIEIRDFRGFPADSVPPIKLGGKNLLVYGENGSGKSTLFEALYQLLDLREKIPFDNILSNSRCLKNCFTDEALTVGKVVLEFTSSGSGSPIPPMVWGIGSRRPTGHPFFRTMARQCGFLDYRAMLQTHFVHRESDGVNLFPLVVQVLLRHVELPVKLVTFGEEWTAIQEEGRKWLELAVRDVTKMDDAEKLLYGLEPPEEPEEGKDATAFDEVGAFESYVAAQHDLVRARIEAFNAAVWQRVLEIQTVANRFLTVLDPWLNIDFEYRSQLKQPDLAADPPWPGNPKLLLRCMFRGRLLEHPATFLNEARLTAVALAFYFAALKVQIPEAALKNRDPRLLVLDDVLIGLDMAHRRPVLELLQKEFVRKGWQILLFTFDRAWYDVARQQLPSLNWRHYELYAIQVGDHEQPLLIPDDEHLDRAFDFLQEGQPKAAAVHVRTAFENELRRACSKLRVPVPFNPDPRKVTANTLWNALKSFVCEAPSSPKCFVDAKGKIHRWQTRPIKKEVIPPALARRVDHSISWVLNPLSHAESIERYRGEIEDAIFAILDLEAEIENALAAQLLYSTEGAVKVTHFLREYCSRIIRAVSETVQVRHKKESS